MYNVEKAIKLLESRFGKDIIVCVEASSINGRILWSANCFPGTHETTRTIYTSPLAAARALIKMVEKE